MRALGTTLLLALVTATTIFLGSKVASVPFLFIIFIEILLAFTHCGGQKRAFFKDI
jgi:hypothetical protein